jgi:hypothetical protein
MRMDTIAGRCRERFPHPAADVAQDDLSRRPRTVKQIAQVIPR